VKNVIYPEDSYRIMGACFEVYREKGCGFLEAVFQECLTIELHDRSISFVAHPNLVLKYKGHTLRQTYLPDFV
jgi:GxxExxY protein